LDDIIKKYPWIISAKNSLIGLVIILALGYFIFVSAREARKDLSNIFSEEKSEVTQVSDVLATGYDYETADQSGDSRQLFGRVWELESGQVEESQDGRESVAKEIKILRVFKKDILNLIGHGDKAEYNKDREELKMTGNVHLESEDKTTSLDTTTLVWRDIDKGLSCPEPVDIWIEDNHILAEMMFSDKDMEKIDFLGRVSMHIVGIDKENFMTKEGWIDFADVRQEGKKDPDNMINVECEYVHYDKIEKRMECYPYIPHPVRMKYHFYLQREDFKAGVDLKFQGEDVSKEEGKSKEELPDYMKFAESTGLEGFEGVIKPDKDKTQTGKTIPPDTKAKKPESGSTGLKAENTKPSDEKKETPRRLASPDPEPYPGMFSDRLAKQVYCWKQNKKIFSNQLDINLKDKILKPRFDVYVWAFDLKKEVQKKHDEENENPSKMMNAIAKETTEVFGDYMDISWKKNFLEAWGGVEIRQKDKYFTTDNMVYSDDLGLLQADGNVLMNQLDGEWLDKEGLLEDMTDEDAKDDAKKPVELRSNGMISYDDRDYIFMTGNVHIKQKDQNIIADEGEFSDKDDMMILMGNVKFRSEDGERLDADKLTIYTETNKYVAEGAVKVRSLVPEEYEDDLKELDNEEESAKKEENPPTDADPDS
jgi:LPS export ABC transporter protein LptC